MSLIYCQKCGHQVDDANAFCTSCGHPIKKVEEVKIEEKKVEEVQVQESPKEFCSNCGSEMQLGQTFCTKCGSAKGQKVVTTPVQTITYKIVKNPDETRSTSKLTELLHTIFKFTALGLYLLGIICLLFIPNMYKISIFKNIINTFKSFTNTTNLSVGVVFNYMNSFLFIMFTLIILLMNISFVVGLFKINNVKRQKFWKSVLNIVSNICMLSWYGKSCGSNTGITIYLVFTILIYLMYLGLYIFKLIKGEFGEYTFKSKRTGKLLASRIIHVAGILVIFFGYAFLSGSDFFLGDYGFEFFSSLNHLSNRSMFVVFRGLEIDNALQFITGLLDYINTYFGILIESVLIAGFIMGVYRLVVADENDEAIVGGFYGIAGRQLIMAFAFLTLFRYDVIPVSGGGSIGATLMNIILDTYLYILFPCLGLLIVIIAFSITHMVIHNKWLRENNFK